jgi:hypothetical protein
MGRIARTIRGEGIGVAALLAASASGLGAQHPDLALHLEQHLRTGTYCCYDPPPEQTIEWQV